MNELNGTYHMPKTASVDHLGAKYLTRLRKGDFMSKKIFIDTFVWGFILWLIGYVLGILLFTVVPHGLIGWIIMPVGVMIALWVLLKKVKSHSFQSYILIAVTWTLIAITCDYVFLVKLFKPTDGYYKLDVYAYYALTFILPLLIGMRKKS